MSLQLVFQLLVIGNLPGLLPDLAGVIVGDVPEFAGTPPVPVKRVLYLTVIEDFRSMGSVDFQHSERLYNCLYSLLL